MANSDIESAAIDRHRRSLVAFSMAVLFVCLANPKFGAANAGGLILIELQYPGVVMLVLVSGLLYSSWNFSVATKSYRMAFERNVLGSLYHDHSFVERVRQHALSALQSPNPPISSRLGGDRPHWVTDEITAGLQRHWGSPSLEIALSDLPYDREKEQGTLRLPRLPPVKSWKGFLVQGKIEFGELTARAKIPIPPPDDKPTQDYPVELEVKIPPLPITWRTWLTRQKMALIEARQGDVYLPMLAPRRIALLAGVAILGETAAMTYAWWTIGSWPIREGLLFDVFITP